MQKLKQIQEAVKCTPNCLPKETHFHFLLDVAERRTNKKRKELNKQCSLLTYNQWAKVLGL